MYKKILVPLDGSRRAESILPHVVEMAKRYDAEVILLRVEEPELLLGWDEVIDTQKYREERARQRKEIETYMASIKKKFENKGINNHVVIRCGSVIKEILNTAENVGADILAMASHGHGGTARTFYGSVSAGVLNQIDRPLLLIRTRRE